MQETYDVSEQDLKCLIINHNIEGVIQNPKRLVSLLQQIKSLQSRVEKIVKSQIEKDGTIKEESISIKEYFDFLNAVWLSKEIDYASLEQMLRKIEFFEEFKLPLTIVVKRKEKCYIEFLVSRLQGPEITIPHQVWYDALASRDPWYCWHSPQIMNLVIEKSLETAGGTDGIIAVCDCEKAMLSMNREVARVLSHMTLDKGTWNEIALRSTRPEIRRVAAQKLREA